MIESSKSRFQLWRVSTLAPFRYRIFATLWWASLASSFGGLIQTVGASWQMALLVLATLPLQIVGRVVAQQQMRGEQTAGGGDQGSSAGAVLSAETATSRGRKACQ